FQDFDPRLECTPLARPWAGTLSGKPHGVSPELLRLAEGEGTEDVGIAGRSEVAGEGCVLADAHRAARDVDGAADPLPDGRDGRVGVEGTLLDGGGAAGNGGGAPLRKGVEAEGLVLSERGVGHGQDAARLVDCPAQPRPGKHAKGCIVVESTVGNRDLTAGDVDC